MAKKATKKPTPKKAAPKSSNIDLFKSQEELVTIASSMESDVRKFVDEGVKASAKRIRASAQELKKAAQQLRKDVMVLVKELRTKKSEE